MFGGGEAVNTVGLVKGLMCLLGGLSWLPMPFGLDEWYMVSAMFITNTNDDWFTLAGDEYICLFVDGDAVTSKNGNGAIITDLTNAHERLGEVRKGIGGCSSVG